jgi:glycosyltransferase involved in cell wall biosynthesis
MNKLIRISTVASTLDILLKGQIAFLNKYFNVKVISGEDIHLENVRKREGVESFTVTMERHISPIKDLISLVKLYIVFRSEKPLIIHSVTPKAGLLCMFAGYLAGVPCRLHTFTGLVFPSKKGIMNWVLKNMDRLLCRFATHIYPEGEGVKRDLINNKITNKPLKIIANGNINGVDSIYFSTNHFSERDNEILKDSLGIKKNDFIFIYVGRLVSDKGINELISAFIKVNAIHENCKLILLGPFEKRFDPLKKKTLEYIENSHDIINLGFREDVRPYYSISDVLVLPSYREGFPNVVIEAGAMQLPCIVTNINGSNEIIINEENGLIIPVKDEMSIFESMCIFLTNNDLLQKCKNNSRQLVIERYDRNLVWNAILNEYKRIESNV